MRQTRQSDYRALTLSLSHRSFIGGDYDIAPGMCTAYSNMVRYIYDLKKKVLRVIRRESRKIPISHRVVDQLSQHHDSQFPSFSTEVLDQMNRKHNRSSSPFTTLADRAESKVAST